MSQEVLKLIKNSPIVPVFNEINPDASLNVYRTQNAIEKYLTLKKNHSIRIINEIKDDPRC